MSARTRLVSCAFVAPVVAWTLVALDVYEIHARSGSTSMVPLAMVLATVASLFAALAWWATCELVRAIGRGARVEYVAAGLLALALYPSHELVEWLVHGKSLSGYIAFPALGAIAMLVGLRFVGRRSVAIAALALALVLHGVNARIYAGLFPALHRSLTAASLALLALGVTSATSRLAPSTRLRALTVMVLGAAAMIPFVGNVRRARAPIAFFGTELAHFYDLVDALLDRDHDGYARAFGGGDCDDTNASVSPGAREIAGNGIDDNCVLGDAPAKAASTDEARDVEVASWRAAHPRPNVLLVFIDTLRADRIHRGLTPNIDAFAADSAVFTQARTTAPRTPHALMSLLRGRFHRRDGRGALDDPHDDWVVAKLHAAGYETRAWLAGRWWPPYRLAAGWDRVAMLDAAATAETMTSAARFWLATAKTPFFAVVHYVDAHAPYLSQSKSSAVEERYDAAVSSIDTRVGALLTDLRARGRMDDTVVVLFGDHGENLGEHGDVGGHHASSIFEDVLHVPLVVHVPGASPRRIVEPVSLADVGPTLLDLAGAAPLDDPDGCSLAGAALGFAHPRGFTLSELYESGHELRAIVEGSHKLIVDVRRNTSLLFDLARDPGESRDVSDEHPDVAIDLRTRLDAWIERRADTSTGANERCVTARDPLRSRPGE